jgi:hypothetical protein
MIFTYVDKVDGAGNTISAAHINALQDQKLDAYDAGAYASFAAAVAAIGATEVPLHVTAASTLAANVTTPATMNLIIHKGAPLTIPNGITLTINGPYTAGLYQTFICTGTGKVVFGAGAVKEVYPEWWGAVGNSTADDTIPVQKAVDCCLSVPSRPLVLTCSGKYKLTSSIIIDRPVDTCLTHGYFRLVGGGRCGGFYVDTNINMFSSSISSATDPVSEGVSFEGLQFEPEYNWLTAYVLNGSKFLRCQFLNCNFDSMKFATAVSPFYIQSISFSHCVMRKWYGTFYDGYRTLDLSFDGCLMEQGELFYTLTGLGSQTVGFRFINNLIEGCSGTGILMGLSASYGVTISGNYFESNECTGGYIHFGLAKGFSFAGNFFQLSTAQNADSAYYPIIFSASPMGCSSGNTSSSRLFDPSLYNAGNLSSIGDVKSVASMGAYDLAKAHFYGAVGFGTDDPSELVHLHEADGLTLLIEGHSATWPANTVDVASVELGKVVDGAGAGQTIAAIRGRLGRTGWNFAGQLLFLVRDYTTGNLTEMARIDPNGNFLVGATAPAVCEKVAIIGSATAAGIYMNDQAPNTTTNTLYRSGNDLYWGATKLN